MFDRRHLLLATPALLLPAVSGVAGKAGAHALRTAKPPASEGTADVRAFGAKGNGKSIDSEAINKAIDCVSTRGGGTVWVPAGTYLSYSIRLKSNITLHLDQGAIIQAAETSFEGLSSGGYDAAQPIDAAFDKFQDFGHSHRRNSLIWGEGLSDIAITGPGHDAPIMSA